MTQQARAQARPPTMVSAETFDDFLAQLRKRDKVRQVKVTDEGLVEPVRRGAGAIVMQPMVRVTATAYDPKANEIVRWEKKWEVGSNVVTLAGGTRGGGHRDVSALHTKDEITGLLQLEQYTVAAGEWTVEAVRDLLVNRSV